jgi:hypothetical protein
MTSSLDKSSFKMSPIRGRLAELPPMINVHPFFLPKIPISRTKLSPQQKGQPDMPIFTLAGCDFNYRYLVFPGDPGKRFQIIGG